MLIYAAATTTKRTAVLCIFLNLNAVLLSENKEKHMVDKKEVLKFIRRTGYKTQSEIRGQYTEGSYELLDASLDYLVSKNVNRKIQFQSPNGVEYLFYLIS